MSEYKAHPRREDKYSSKGKHYGKCKSKDKDKRRSSKGVYKKVKARAMVAGASDVDSAQATRSQAQEVKMKTPGGSRARRVQAGTSVD
jgi:hypothetical protein